MQRRVRHTTSTQATVGGDTIELRIRHPDSPILPKFVSVELQRDRLIVFCAEALATSVIWEMTSGKFKLQLDASLIDKKLPPGSRFAYEMRPKQPRPQLEEELAHLSERVPTHSGNELLVFCAILINGCIARASRYSALGVLDAQVCTLGTRIPYRMQTTDISRSGLFLTSGHGEAIPFSINTLLEITLELTTDQSDRTQIRCLGKVVRCVNSRAPSRKIETVGIGVQIVEMDGESVTTWEHWLRKAAEAQKNLSKSE
jgi:hypothetical protein